MARFYVYTGNYAEYMLILRREIQSTLERLKEVEGELTTKERELREREVQLKAWEKDLQHQMYVTVSSSLFLTQSANHGKCCQFCHLLKCFQTSLQKTV